MGSLGDLFPDGLDYNRVIVAQDESAVPSEIVDELVPVYIPFVRSTGSRDVNGVRLQISRVVSNSRRKDLPGLLVQTP